MTDQRGKGGFSYLACVSVTVQIIHSFKAAIIVVGATDRHYDATSAIVFVIVLNF